MVKVHTPSERESLKRVRRLRKKLHVAEFKRSYLSLDLTLPYDIDVDNDDECDALLDKIESYVHSKFGEIPLYLAFLDTSAMSFSFDLPHQVLNESNAETVANCITVIVGGTLKKYVLDDAYYPSEE